MLGFMRIARRAKPVTLPAYLSPVSCVTHADNVGTFALAHSRVPYTNISGQVMTNIEVFYTHFSYNASLEWAPSSTLTVRAAVEYPVGTITSLTTDGTNRDITMAGGAVGAALKASGINIPNGAVYYIRTRCICTGGDGQLPRAYNNGTSFEGGTIQSYLGATNDGSDYTTSGTQPTSSGKGYGPSGICSREVGHKSRSFAIFGDSIYRGWSGVSPAEVAAHDAGYGYINFSFSGGKIQSGGNQNPVRRRALMVAMGITDVLVNYPVNDLIAGRTVSQIQTDFSALWANLKADGIQKIIQATCTPKTDDATSPGTISTTPAGAFTGGASSYRSQINAWLRSTVGQAGKPDLVWDFADLMETARDSGLWLNPTVNSGDGLHPSATGATTAGANLKTFLLNNGF